MDPKTRRQLVNTVITFLKAIAGIAGAVAEEIIREAVEAWLKTRSKKAKITKKPKGRKKS